MIKSFFTQHFSFFVKYLVSCGTFLRDNSSLAIISSALVAIIWGGKYLISREIIPFAFISNDFTSIFIYFSDILAVFLIIYSIQSKSWSPGTLIPLFLWLLFQISLISDYQLISIYYGSRLVISLLLYGVLSKLTLNQGEKFKISLLFAVFGGIQSILAIYQSLAQKSLGLSLLGESPLNTATSGVATFSLYSEKLLRAYGTFPHPNLLAAFLLATTLLNLYLLTKTKQTFYWLSLLGLFALNLAGLMSTLSRSAIILGILAIKISAIIWVFSKFWHHIRRGLAIKVVAITIILMFTPYIQARSSLNNASTQERVLFTQIALESIQDNGFLGQGIGNSMFHMKQYTNQELNPWEYQPIHNYYLIAMAELGMGALVIFYIIYKVAQNLLLKIKTSWRGASPSFTWNITLSSIFFAFLFLNLFDHYFYTLWQGQILFWSIAGLAVARTEES